MKKEIAILMAAGKGERMRPITESIPKPLVKVNGVSMIETVIKALEYRGIKDIYVVVGYLADKFVDLKETYPYIHFVENKEYTIKNNISSIYAVKDILGTANCFICEADLVISDSSILDRDFNESGYYGKFVEGHSDDWVMDLKDGYITRIGKYGDNAYNLTGICYLTKNDSQIVKDKIEEAYKHKGHENLFWDEIVNQNLDKLKMIPYPVSSEKIIEIDSVKELQEIDSSYNNF